LRGKTALVGTNSGDKRGVRAFALRKGSKTFHKNFLRYWKRGKTGNWVKKKEIPYVGGPGGMKAQRKFEEKGRNHTSG